MTLEQEIDCCDGKSSSDIGGIYDRHKDHHGFTAKLIELSQKAEHQTAATWLLKRHLESDGKLAANEIKKLFKTLPTLESWESKLHVLQCIPFMPIGRSQKKGVEAFLRLCLSDSNKFVRAWAYNGFYELACQHSEYKEEAKLFFKMAMKDEAPSVKARIRNIKFTWH